MKIAPNERGYFNFDYLCSFVDEKEPARWQDNA